VVACVAFAFSTLLRRYTACSCIIESRAMLIRHAQSNRFPIASVLVDGPDESSIDGAAAASRSLSRLVPGRVRTKRPKGPHAAPAQQISPPIAKEPAERNRERHEEAYALLLKSIKRCQKHDADGLVDFENLRESPQSGDDGLLRRVNAILEERRRSISDKNTWTQMPGHH
jgi:hypothetical protein